MFSICSRDADPSENAWNDDVDQSQEQTGKGANLRAARADSMSGSRRRQIRERQEASRMQTVEGDAKVLDWCRLER